MPTCVRFAFAKRKILRLLLVSALWMTSIETRDAGASTSVFQSFGSICVTVYELRGRNIGLSNEELADNFSDAIIPRLQADAATRNKFVKVRARRDCIKPDAPAYEQQLRLDLFVNRQSILVNGQQLYVVVVGGSTINACEPLCAHNMQPVVLVTSEKPSDQSIERALEEFTRREILSFVRE